MIPTGIAESCEEVHTKLLTVDSSGAPLTKQMISAMLRRNEEISDVFKTINIRAVVDGDKRLAIVYGKTRLPDDLIQKIEHLDVYEISCIDEDTNLRPPPRLWPPQNLLGFTKTTEGPDGVSYLIFENGILKEARVPPNIFLKKSTTYTIWHLVATFFKEGAEQAAERIVAE